jgi:hypothetical protein
VRPPAACSGVCTQPTSASTWLWDLAGSPPVCPAPYASMSAYLRCVYTRVVKWSVVCKVCGVMWVCVCGGGGAGPAGTHQPLRWGKDTNGSPTTTTATALVTPPREKPSWALPWTLTRRDHARALTLVPVGPGDLARLGLRLRL